MASKKNAQVTKKQPTAAEKQAKAERDAKKAEKARARQAKLAKLAKDDPKKVAVAINFREYRKLHLETHRKQLQDLAADKKMSEERRKDFAETAKQSDWDLFCEFKAQAFTSWWLSQKGKKDKSAKSIERKKARLLKAKEKMEELQKELEALGIETADSK